MLDLRRSKIYRGRNIKFLLISLCLHSMAFIILVFTLYSQGPVKNDDAVQLSFVDAENLRPKRPRAPKLFEVKRLDPTMRKIATKESTKMMQDESNNKFDEVIKQAPIRLTRSATVERQMEKTDMLPDVMTMAEGLNQDEITLHRQMSTRNAPEAGDGMESFRQRVSGRGKGGLRMAQMVGKVDDIGIPGGQGQIQSDTIVELKPSSPFGNALFNIAQHILESNQTGYADVVFVLDTSSSMQDNIQKVADALFSMTDAYDRAGLDYRLGYIEFSVRRQGNRIEIDPLTPDPGLLQRRMKMLRISGDEHALDALWKGLTYLEFRPEAERYLVLVTDEPASTGWRERNAYQQRRDWVLQECERLNVQVEVLGYNEYFQRQLAQRTGGLWQEIPGGQRAPSVVAQGAGLPTLPRANEKLLKSFRDIARHIARAGGGGAGNHEYANVNTKMMDIVIMMDYSLSMAGKAQAIEQGLSNFIGTLNLFPLDYKVGLIRFAVAKNAAGAIDGAVVTQLSLDEESLMNLLTYPFGGDEHLIDAIVEGLPRVRFRNAQRAVFIITDEPSTGKYDVSEALNVCKSLNVQVNVLGPMPSGATNTMIASGFQLPGDDFQALAVNQTGGIFRPMPNSIAIADVNQ